jgi:CheY-like chemotaxis protein
MSILIAEDNNAQRHYLSELLAREFPKAVPVIEAEDGEAAVHLALEHRPTLSIQKIKIKERCLQNIFEQEIIFELKQAD